MASSVLPEPDNDTRIKEALEKNLKCYFCDSGPISSRPRWFRCRSMHHICQDCKEVVKISHCPCGAKILAANCQITEELLKAKVAKNRCVYEDFGCHYKVDENTRLDHEKDCEYRLIKCPFYFCGVTVPFNAILNHVTNDDEVTKTFTSQTLELKVVDEIQLEKDSLRIGFRLGARRLEVDGQVFFAYGLTLKDGETFFHWVTMIGTREEAEKYKYVFSYYGGKDPDLGIAYAGRVLPVEEDKHEIMENLKCFALNFDVLKEQLVTKDYKFKYSVRIQKKDRK